MEPTWMVWWKQRGSHKRDPESKPLGPRENGRWAEPGPGPQAYLITSVPSTLITRKLDIQINLSLGPPPVVTIAAQPLRGDLNIQRGSAAWRGPTRQQRRAGGTPPTPASTCPLSGSPTAALGWGGRSAPTTGETMPCEHCAVLAVLTGQQAVAGTPT